MRGWPAVRRTVPVPKWVCTELRDGLKLWVDLADIGVSAGCLLNDWEPSTTAFILAALGPGDVFVDVGANIGWFTILAAHRVGVSGHVWAFEPRPGTCGRLADSVSANGFEGPLLGPAGGARRGRRGTGTRLDPCREKSGS